MKTLRTDWKVNLPMEFHPATSDGDRMDGGPTEEYYQVWAHYVPTGNCTLGRGKTKEAALAELEVNITKWVPPITFASLQAEIGALNDRLTKAGL